MRNFRSNSKYHSQKVTINGETFDSKKEYRRYNELLFLEKAGHISCLERQVKFVLIPSQKDPVTKKVIERPVSYIADFAYKENGVYVVEDTKGVKTKDYILKRKLMLWVHGVRIKEV